MFPWILRAVVVFSLLSAVYIALRVYARWATRRRLEARWAAGDRRESREDYVEKRLDAYERSLRPRLLIGVYLIPAAVIALLVWLAQVS